MHERAPRGRFCLSEYAPNHAWRTKGGISGKSHIRKWAICRKNENLTLWKCARMHERAPRGRFLLSEHAPNHAWHTKGGINGKSHIRKCIICRKNENFTVWKCMKRRLVGKKAIFQYWEFPEMPPSQEGVGHAWRFLMLRGFTKGKAEKNVKIWWNFGENLMKIWTDLVCIVRFLNFVFDFVKNLVLFCILRKKKIKIC